MQRRLMLAIVAVMGAILLTSVSSERAAAQDSAASVAQNNAKPKKKKVRRDPNLVTSEEIDDVRSDVTDAYELVQRLRPQWLRTHGSTGLRPVGAGTGIRTNGGSAAPPNTPRVLRDDVPVGDINALRGINPAVIKEMRFLDARKSTTLYGTGYDSGAILIITGSS